MNRNTWIILIVAVIVIIGLIWIFNRGPAATAPTILCTASIESGGKSYCTSMVRAWPIDPSSGAVSDHG